MSPDFNFRFWLRWLQLATVAVASGGFLLALFPDSAPVELLAISPIDPAFWPRGTPVEVVGPYRAWAFGVLGSSMGGWGMLMAYVAWGPLRRRERWAWFALIVPLTCWVFLDSALSLLHGATFNAALNLFLFILFALPLLGSWRWLRVP